MSYRLLDRLKISLSASTDHLAVIQSGQAVIIAAPMSQMQQHACHAGFSLYTKRPWKPSHDGKAQLARRATTLPCKSSTLRQTFRTKQNFRHGHG